MANFRQIHVSIWKDGWFLDLDPDEKLLFVYLFSNESTSLSGIYRLPKKIIVFETCIDKNRVDEILAKFESDKKVYYEGDVIWVVNMRRFHETKSNLVQIRINKDIDMIHDCDIKRRYLGIDIPYPYPIDTKAQLKEEEKEKKKEEEGATPGTFYCTPLVSQDIFIEVTQMTTFPASHRQDAIDAIRAIAADKKDQQEVSDYLAPFYAEWKARNYHKTNLAWLTDWAVTKEIPPKKANGEKPRTKILKGPDFDTNPNDFKVVQL